MRTRLFLPAIAAGCLAAVSCSSGPQPPQPGTPAFIWNAARTTYHAGDFVKTGENLQQLIKGESEFAAKARPWAIVISSGLAQGYAATADAYDAGARANRQSPMPFRKEASQLRSLASAASLEFAEDVHLYLEKDKSASVPLAFEQPTGAAAEPGGLKKVTSGAWIQDSERELLLTAMLQRGVLLSASRAAGSPDDAAKTLETLKNGDAQSPRALFLLAMAGRLYDQSALFGPTKLDMPNRLRMLCSEAMEALQGLPESKESKALAAKIQASLKKIGAAT